MRGYPALRLPLSAFPPVSGRPAPISERVAAVEPVSDYREPASGRVRPGVAVSERVAGEESVSGHRGPASGRVSGDAAVSARWASPRRLFSRPPFDPYGRKHGRNPFPERKTNKRERHSNPGPNTGNRAPFSAERILPGIFDDPPSPSGIPARLLPSAPDPPPGHSLSRPIKSPVDPSRRATPRLPDSSS
jgi:hypothetical protein